MILLLLAPFVRLLLPMPAAIAILAKLCVAPCMPQKCQNLANKCPPTWTLHFSYFLEVPSRPKGEIACNPGSVHVSKTSQNMTAIKNTGSRNVSCLSLFFSGVSRDRIIDVADTTAAHLPEAQNPTMNVHV